MRKGRAKDRIILPDPRYGDTLVTKFVNNLMQDGKKSVAYKIFYEAMDIIEAKMEEERGVDVWKKALENSAGNELLMKKLSDENYYEK